MTLKQSFRKRYGVVSNPAHVLFTTGFFISQATERSGFLAVYLTVIVRIRSAY